MTPRKNRRKISYLFSLTLFVLLFSSVFFTNTVLAQQKGYQLLAEIPTITQPTDGTAIPFPVYLKGLIVAIVGLSIIFAVIMIVIGGIEYVAAVVPSAKSEGKKKIIGAISGLLVAIFSYLLLITINPDLTIVGFNLDTVPASIYPEWKGGAGNSSIGKVGDPGVGGVSSGGGGGGGGGGGNGNGSCTPISGGYCDADSLVQYFGVYAERMSAICNVESRGKVGSESTSDICRSDGTVFSFGLFQINLVVHDLNGLDCTYLHDPKIRAFNIANRKDVYTCSLNNKTMYDKCVAAAKDPIINIRYAVVLLNSKRGFNHWGANSKCGFSK